MNRLSLWNQDDWSLFQDFDRLHKRMGSLMNSTSGSEDSDWSVAAFKPACDVQETDGHFVMSFDLPGMKREDIKISVEDSQLTVTGERRYETSSEKANHQRRERFFGSFQRSFSLPQQVDTNKIEAEYQDGVLNLVLPKLESSKPREIKVGSDRSNILDRVFGKRHELKEAK